MDGKFLLFGMIQYFVFAVVLFRKIGHYLKSQKSGGDTERPILRWWEAALMTMSFVVWIVLMFCFSMAFARETIVNALTGVLIALGLTAMTPILAPPSVYIVLLAVILHEDYKRGKQRRRNRII